ncbi:MAG: valine--tRNA ligase [Candidatus Omnitrophota bacterium]|jgi:valyl-tRNA synthetase
MIELSKQYNPKETEDTWYKYWEEKGYFSAQPDPGKKPFCIVIPPPNVTGILHMGHALNNTIQDILIRYHRMKGDSSLWMPGTDHAGIATQNVVEKAIAKEGLKRQDLGREKFVERVWQWKEQYGSTIIRQLKKLGASCDWERTRFTMDEEYSKAVITVFIELWDKGLIYQGHKVINWCPRCQTALSDEEAPHHDLQGNLYYLKYPFKDNPDEFITVATTRPETMLGDTAVAVNPRDRRYKKYIGRVLALPLVNRGIKIIADDMVDKRFGTGAVKVTPAHDPNDYAMGTKHGLEFVNVMRPDGRMNEKAGDYRDMDRFEAREVIIEDLKEKGLLEKIEPHQLSAGHCYRCHTIIEPYLSKQWFVKMAPLAKPAIEAVKKGKITFHPRRWTKVYLSWMENIQDWCISRQIWWGHRLPVYYCKSCRKQANEFTVDSSQFTEKEKKDKENRGVIVAAAMPEKCPVCGSTEISQEEDVLDTWFSSWLWPFAAFYWPDDSSPQRRKDLEYFYPTAVLVTAPEIIFFWVARMIMAGLEFKKDLPFKDVYLHGTVRDREGKKMSKSLGNVIDPLEIINEYGTDALRFSLISITAQGQDVFLSKERFEQGRNFCNKIWNASRFILMNLDQAVIAADLPADKNDPDMISRWVLSRFYSALKEVSRDLETFKFNEAANQLYSFFWHEFCDWYLELIKQDIKNPRVQAVMRHVLDNFLRAAHPFMPFITEELWQRVKDTGLPVPQVTGEAIGESIMVSSWPKERKDLIDKKIEGKMSGIFELINVIRNMRSELEVPLHETVNVKICTGDKTKIGLYRKLAPQIQTLAKVHDLHIMPQYVQARGEFVTVLSGAHIVITFTGEADAQKFRQKMGQKIVKTESEIRSKETALANDNFVKRAPAEVVEKERARLQELKGTLIKLKAVRDGLA